MARSGFRPLILGRRAVFKRPYSPICLRRTKEFGNSVRFCRHDGPVSLEISPALCQYIDGLVRQCIPNQSGGFREYHKEHPQAAR